MNSFGGTCAVLAVVSFALPACKRDGDSPATANSSASAAATATAAASASTPSGTEAKIARVCPLPRRCTEACKKAHFAALDTCKPEWQLAEKSMSNEWGACVARCLTSKNPNGCVGAANKTECDCEDQCAAAIPESTRAKSEPYLKCYAGAVAAACN